MDRTDLNLIIENTFGNVQKCFRFYCTARITRLVASVKKRDIIGYMSHIE